MKNRIIIALLSILIIVLGFTAYLLSSKALVSPKRFESEITKVEDVSESDDIEDIEKDLDETDLDSIGTELSDIEAELN